MIILFLLFYLSHPGNSFQAASPEKKRQRGADAVRNEAMKYEMGRGGYAVDEKEAARLYRRAALKFEDHFPIPKSLNVFKVKGCFF